MLSGGGRRPWDSRQVAESARSWLLQAQQGLRQPDTQDRLAVLGLPGWHAELPPRALRLDTKVTGRLQAAEQGLGTRAVWREQATCPGLGTREAGWHTGSSQLVS